MVVLPGEEKLVVLLTIINFHSILGLLTEVLTASQYYLYQLTLNQQFIPINTESATTLPSWTK